MSCCHPTRGGPQRAIWRWAVRGVGIWPGWTRTTLPCPIDCKRSMPALRRNPRFISAVLACSILSNQAHLSCFQSSRAQHEPPRCLGCLCPTVASWCGWTRCAPLAYAMTPPWQGQRTWPFGPMPCSRPDCRRSICKSRCCTIVMRQQPMPVSGTCAHYLGMCFLRWVSGRQAHRRNCMQG